MATRQVNNFTSPPAPSRWGIFLKFSVPTLVVFLLVVYFVIASVGPEEKMLAGVGFLLLYLILLGIIWSVSRTLHDQAVSLQEYATGLESKVKERTQDLEESNKREVAALKELSRLKDDFVFIAAHEVRSPVTVIQWSIDKFFHERKFLDSLPEDLKHAFSVMETATKRLSSLIVDLLSVARLDSGTITFIRNPLSLNEILKPLLEEYGATAKEKDISIKYPEEKFAQLPQVLSDEVRLKEVFGNLLSNAIKFNQKGGEIKLDATKDKKFVTISVKDTGIGIAKDDLPKLFTKFFRAKEEIDGTGLGLWISKEIMRRLYGDITVKSEERKGTEFEVLVPLKP